MPAAENVETPDVEERDQQVYPPRGEEDLEEVINGMEEVENEEVEEAVRQISSVTDDNLRNGQNSVGDHFRAPIRSLNNPGENEVAIQKQYKPGEDTILSNTDSVEAFNKLLNDQEPPTKEGQVVGEEYFVGQNLPGFQDVGNIKWWTVMEENSYREETRNGGLEHLNLNNEGDIHSYRVEIDGEPLDSEGVQRLARNLRIRSETQVTNENTIPQHILRHDSREEVLENEDLTEDEYSQQLEEAVDYGLITEDGELTLKGWTVGANLEAPDLRQLDEINNGDDIVNFRDNTETGLELDIAELGASARVQATTDYVRGNLRDLQEEGQVNVEDGEEFPGEVKELMDEYGWAGFSTDQSRRERQEVEHEMPLSEYLEEVENIDIERTDDDRLVIRNKDLEYLTKEEIHEELILESDDDTREAHSEIYDQLQEAANGRRDVDVDITDANVDYELNLIAKNDNGEEISWDESETPNTLLEEIEEGLQSSIEFDSGDEMHATTPFRDIGCGAYDNWTRKFDNGDGRTTEFSETVSLDRPVKSLLKTKHGDELEELKDGYGHVGVRGEYIPRFEDASQELKETVEALEDHGLIRTEDVTEEEAKLNITADELEYREAIQKIEDIDAVTFTDTEYQGQREEIRERVPLEEVSANIEVKDGHADELAERLEDYEEEVLVELGVATETVAKDERVPQTKEYIHEELEAGKLGDLVSSITPELKHGEQERVPDYEDWSAIIDHPLKENIEDVADYARTNTPSRELMDELAEMYEDGLIDGELDRKVKNDKGERNGEHIPIPGEARIENYRELDEETVSELEDLDERGLITLEKPEYHLELKTHEYEDDEIIHYEPQDRLQAEVEGEAESTELEMGETTVTIEGNYDTTGDTSYRAGEELKRIAGNLDPLNFDSEPYEEVTVETNFDYGKEVPA